MLAKTRSGKRAGQLQSELDAMVAEFAGATSYLEVGARYGDTLWDVAQALAPGAKIAVVDMPGDVWGNHDAGPVLAGVCADIKAMGHTVELIIGDSRNPAVIERARGVYDACLIDADHRYEGVKADWLAYGPMCKRVAFHDIVGHGQRCGPGAYVEVPKLWAEIKKPGDLEIVAPGSKMGIGITRGGAE